MAEKKTFIMRDEWGSLFTSLPAEKAGELIQAVYLLRAGESPSVSDPVLAAVLQMIGGTLNADQKKYEERCEQNATNRQAAEEKKRSSTKPDDRQRSSTVVNEVPRNGTDNDSDNDSDSESDNEDEYGFGEANASGLKTLCPAGQDGAARTEAEDIREIISYLNQVCGTKYLPGTEATRKLIRARFHEGFTVGDFITVIDKMADKWKGDPKMSQFLRPQTLFSNKFESYLNWRVGSRLDVIDQWAKEVEYGTPRVFDSGEEYQGSVPGHAAG